MVSLKDHQICTLSFGRSVGRLDRNIAAPPSFAVPPPSDLSVKQMRHRKPLTHSVYIRLNQIVVLDRSVAADDQQPAPEATAAASAVMYLLSGTSSSGWDYPLAGQAPH